MNKERGFTLLELMIVVAIIAIISAIAFPSYKQHVLRSYRVEARNTLQMVSQKIEQNYALTHNYKKMASDATKELNDDTIKSWGLSEIPAGSSRIRYKISLANITAVSYTLQAEAVNAQADDKDCAKFYYTQSNVKKASASGQSEPDNGRNNTSIECWSR